MLLAIVIALEFRRFSRRRREHDAPFSELRDVPNAAVEPPPPSAPQLNKTQQGIGGIVRIALTAATTPPPPVVACRYVRGSTANTVSTDGGLNPDEPATPRTLAIEIEAGQRMVGAADDVAPAHG